MRGRVMLLTGAAIGYVLGARAGRGRYEQIKEHADVLWNDPRVQDKVGQAHELAVETATSAGQAVVDAAKDKAPEIRATLGDVADTARNAVSSVMPGQRDDASGTSETARTDPPYGGTTWPGPGPTGP
ncbi:hypothetical protein KEM60_01319 [Austwickia sp. TVS 96-490-7B]|uniref:YtxH domain-containing protein n=1 Tax=Austwickia sp. TVS 96-490-7B TaxID=2830843 RepID=UPI001C56DAE9|nr:YtxH domain-containing protein [Austwickia sp. TVS 96-490-7B]MBW3085123.1 hypothetical protein [Austwickia sp. TVS 96-490-7B]